MMALNTITINFFCDIKFIFYFFDKSGLIRLIKEKRKQNTTISDERTIEKNKRNNRKKTKTNNRPKTKALKNKITQAQK